jgi:hypothetical protein
MPCPRRRIRRRPKRPSASCSSRISPKKNHADTVALAAKLLKYGRDTKEDSASRYVLFREARDLAIRAGDWGLAFTVIDELADQFETGDNRLVVKLQMLERANRQGSTAAAMKAVPDLALQLAGEAVDIDDFAFAAKAVKLARAVAVRLNQPSYDRHFQQWEAELAELETEIDPLKPLLGKIGQLPEGSVDCFNLGIFFGMFKGDWERALPLLAKGNDPRIRNLAKSDLLKPKTSADQILLGDRWWGEGQTKTGIPRRRVIQRAAYWYATALSSLEGLNKTKLEKRLAEVEPEMLWPVEFRVRVGIDGHDTLTGAAGKLTWNHLEAGGPSMAQINSILPWNPQRDREIKLAGKTKLFPVGIDFSRSRITQIAGRNEVRLTKTRDSFTLDFNDPQPGPDTYEVIVRVR